MKYKIKRVRYDNGEKAPWWKIVVYKNNRPFDEVTTQYSSFLDVLKLWLFLTIIP